MCSSSNIQDGARLDIAASGCWGGNHERTFFDVRVFNPHAPSNRCSNISSCYKKHERIKKTTYEQRIREVEHATFTPLVLSATGGLANEASTFYKRLATLLAIKRNDNYSTTLSWIRNRLSFSLLRSAIRCIRGTRSSCGHAPSLVSQATPSDPQHRICITSYRYAEKGSGERTIPYLFQWNARGQLLLVKWI